MMYDGTGWGWGWSAMMLMPLLWITLLGVIIWAVVQLTQHRNQQQGSGQPPAAPRESPQEILDRRFASGDIDAQAYTRAREQLAGRDPGSS